MNEIVYPDQHSKGQTAIVIASLFGLFLLWTLVCLLMWPPKAGETLPRDQQSGSPLQQCQEDQACWVCTEMGNQRCGPDE